VGRRRRGIREISSQTGTPSSSVLLLLTHFIPLQQPTGRPEEATVPSYVEGSGEVNLDDWDSLLKGSGTLCFYGSGELENYDG